jgi:AraC-like DNA-binding protein
MERSPKTRTALLEAILTYLEEGTGAATAGPSASPRALRPSLDIAGIASLLDVASRLLDDDAIGLHFAAGVDFDALGLFSYAVLHAPTVGTALRNMERYSDAVVVGVPLRLDVETRTASLRFPVWDAGDPQGLRHLDEAAVFFVLRMLRRLAGPGWSARAVAFRHAAPADPTVQRRLLGVPVLFGEPESRIVFAAADLERRVRNAERFQLPIVQRHLEDVVREDGAPDSWRHELELQIASLVCDGHPSLHTIAPRLGMSVRTLQRRLDERGLRYRDLVAGVRMRIARHCLTERAHGPSLGEIGFMLGYSELSAFDRAFRRWTGMSPGEYRRRAARGDARTDHVPDARTRSRSSVGPGAH